MNRIFSPRNLALRGWVGLLMVSNAVCGQGFGQNKIGYTTFQFRLQQTRNFELYNYLTNDSVSHFWARQSERWYRTQKNVLWDSIPFRNERHRGGVHSV